MDIRLELIKKYIVDTVCSSISNISIDADKIADSTAISALKEIRDIIANDELSDFDALEAIVCVFEKYKLDCGSRHDF